MAESDRSSGATNIVGVASACPCGPPSARTFRRHPMTDLPDLRNLMTPRILLLVFATAAFVGIWKNLDEGAPRTIAASKAVRRQPVAAVTHRVVTREGESVAIPLPVELTPGTYRVLNTRGFEATLEWTTEELPAGVGSP